MLRQKISEQGFCFLNTEYEKFNTMKAMYAHLRTSGHGEAAIQMFDRNYKSLQVPIENPRIKTEQKKDSGNSDDDEMLSDQESEKEFEQMNGNEDEMDENDNEEEEPGELDWTEETGLPAGWRVSSIRVQQGSLAGLTIRRYMEQDGETVFANLPEALRYMERENYSEQDRLAMQGKLQVHSM